MTDGAHSHASDPAIAAETLRAEGVEGSLSARITALENASTVPPVTPPTTGNIAGAVTDEATGKPMGRYICPKNRCHDGHEWVVKVNYGFWHMINQKVYVCARCGTKDLLR